MWAILRLIFLFISQSIHRKRKVQELHHIHKPLQLPGIVVDLLLSDSIKVFCVAFECIDFRSTLLFRKRPRVQSMNLFAKKSGQ